MSWTRHGHHIEGSDYNNEAYRPAVARCGGPSLCDGCKADVIAFHQANPEILRCRCGKLKTEESPGCEWHDAHSETSHVPEGIPFSSSDELIPDQYFDKIKRLVVEVYNEKINDDRENPLTVEEVYIPWFSKTLKNWKATASTSRADGRYYEVTYDGVNHCAYVDVYVKALNVVKPDFT